MLTTFGTDTSLYYYTSYATVCLQGTLQYPILQYPYMTGGPSTLGCPRRSIP